MPRYKEKSRDTRQSDETLTVMLLVGSGVAALMIGMSFYKDTLTATAIRRRQPWDV